MSVLVRSFRFLLRFLLEVLRHCFDEVEKGDVNLQKTVRPIRNSESHPKDTLPRHADAPHPRTVYLPAHSLVRSSERAEFNSHDICEVFERAEVDSHDIFANRYLRGCRASSVPTEFARWKAGGEGGRGREGGGQCQAKTHTDVGRKQTKEPRHRGWSGGGRPSVLNFTLRPKP